MQNTVTETFSLKFISSVILKPLDKMQSMMSECMVMQNGFQIADGGDHCIRFLFDGWDVDNHLKYGFMLAGVFLMGFFNGFLAYLRHRLLEYSKINTNLLLNQIYMSLLYGVQIVLAYWIMLLIMTYETGLFITLVWGLVIGYFVFGYIEARGNAKTTSKIGSTYQMQFNSTPCCQSTA